MKVVVIAHHLNPRGFSCESMIIHMDKNRLKKVAWLYPLAGSLMGSMQIAKFAISRV